MARGKYMRSNRRRALVAAPALVLGALALAGCVPSAYVYEDVPGATYYYGGGYYASPPPGYYYGPQGYYGYRVYPPPVVYYGHDRRHHRPPTDGHDRRHHRPPTDDHDRHRDDGDGRGGHVPSDPQPPHNLCAVRGCGGADDGAASQRRTPRPRIPSPPPKQRSRDSEPE